MCGIAGTVGGGSSEAIRAMTDAVAHRGPDDAGIAWFDDGPCGLGHRRLAIIDLSAGGHQPMSDEGGQVWVTYNGEIYNFGELRQDLEQRGCAFRTTSDTEVLLRAYEQWGEDCLDRLNGMFAFAIYDRRRRRLFAARDRIGIKPFYYWHGRNTLVFASEIKSLIASGLVPVDPDLEALHTPTRFQVSPHTGFRDIRKLPPAHRLTFEAGRLDVRPYWTIEPREDADMTEAEATDRLDAHLQRAVALEMTADVPVGVLLSGGLDSSVISALMRPRTSQPIHSFTIRYAEADRAFERGVDDSHYARQVADRLGFAHQEFAIAPDVVHLLPKLVWHLDEPLADPAAINTYIIAKAARDHGIVVLLNGMGGDEVFGGYPKYLACLTADAYQAVLPGVCQRWLRHAVDRLPVATARRGFRSLRVAKRFLSYASLPRVERFLASDLSLGEADYTRLFASPVPYRDTAFYRTRAGQLARADVSYLTAMCLDDTRVFLPEHNLCYSDKASMAAGVESRPPLCDHEVVELMFSLPPSLRIRGRTQKYLLKRVTERYLPRPIVHRKKAPFGSPLRAWIRGPLEPMVGDILSEASVRARGLYDHRRVARLIEDDRRGRADHSLAIWMLLTTELWFRTFWPASGRAGVLS